MPSPQLHCRWSCRQHLLNDLVVYMYTFVYTFLLDVLHACRREKKGVKSESSARASVYKTYNLFMKAAKFSGAPTAKIVPLIDLGLMSTSEVITKVEEALAHLPGRTSFDHMSAQRSYLEQNWFSLRDAFNRRLRALEHGTHMMVHMHTHTQHIHEQLCTHVCVHNYTTIVYTCCYTYTRTHTRVHTHTHTHTQTSHTYYTHPHTTHT